MNCEQYDDLLDDYVDGVRAADRPADDRRVRFERHLDGCQRCQALVADFASIRRTAATLEEHLPPPRLWPRIESSIEARPRWFAAWMPVAVAASLALVIAGATWLAWQGSLPGASQAPALTANESPARPAEAHYAEAIAGLQQLADSQSDALDPQTRAVLQQNLAVIDRAIDESRTALAADPASAVAEESLLDALDTKIALLEDTVALAAEDLNQ